MKKLITTAGLAALGAASLNAQQVYAPAPGLTTTQLSKPWSVSAAVRGFYDDNYALTPSGGFINPATGARITPQSSWGYEITPGVGLNWAMEQTFISLSYVYSAKYYEDRPDNKWDQSHLLNFKFSHAFSDRYKIELQDSFVDTKEPDLLATGSQPSSTLRSRQDMLRNYGSMSLSAGLTDQLSVVGGYSNTLYDFSDTGPGSLSALLDRMEHLITLNLRWQWLPSTVALVGYNFGMFDYSDNELTGIANPNFGHGSLQPILYSDDRNMYSHYIYVGADHSFNPQLDGSVRIGAQYVDYYNLPGASKTEWDPYVDANLTYRMTTDSSVQVGVRHSVIATDGAALGQENTTVYGSLSYRVLPPLTTSLLGQYQYNTFQEGVPAVGSGTSFKDKAENFFLVGLNASYEFNKFLAAEAGYNFDRLDSDISYRTFSRNRVYFGLRASY